MTVWHIFVCLLPFCLCVTMEELLSRNELETVLDSWYQQIVSQVKGDLPLAIVGIRTRGVPLAQNIRDILQSKQVGMDQDSIPLGRLDITLYRDDFSQRGIRPDVQGTEIMFDVSRYHILLVDDVLFTGRTVRAALDEIFDFGRPLSVDLAVTIDRGGRELPIQPGMVGKKMDEVSPDHLVKLRLDEIDSQTGVFLKQ